MAQVNLERDSPSNRRFMVTVDAGKLVSMYFTSFIWTTLDPSLDKATWRSGNIVIKYAIDILKMKPANMGFQLTFIAAHLSDVIATWKTKDMPRQCVGPVPTREEISPRPEAV